MENKGRGFHIFVAGVSFGLISLFSTVFWAEETDFIAGIELSKGRLRFDRGAAAVYSTTPHILIFQGYPGSFHYPFNNNITDFSVSPATPNDPTNSCSKIKISSCTTLGSIEYMPSRLANRISIHNTAAGGNRGGWRLATLRYTFYDKIQGADGATCYG